MRKIMPSYAFSSAQSGSSRCVHYISFASFALCSFQSAAVQSRTRAPCARTMEHLNERIMSVIIMIHKHHTLRKLCTLSILLAVFSSAMHAKAYIYIWDEVSARYDVRWAHEDASCCALRTENNTFAVRRAGCAHRHSRRIMILQAHGALCKQYCDHYVLSVERLSAQLICACTRFVGCMRFKWSQRDRTDKLWMYLFGKSALG